MRPIRCSVSLKAGLAAATLAAFVAAFSVTSARAGGYEFETLNDPVDQPFMGATFTNLLGIDKSGLIAGFYGSGQAGIPTRGSCSHPQTRSRPRTSQGRRRPR